MLSEVDVFLSVTLAGLRTKIVGSLLPPSWSFSLCLWGAMDVYIYIYIYRCDIKCVSIAPLTCIYFFRCFYCSFWRVGSIIIYLYIIAYKKERRKKGGWGWGWGWGLAQKHIHTHTLFHWAKKKCTYIILSSYSYEMISSYLIII